MDDQAPILSSRQVAPLLQARQAGQREAPVSLDLGLTTAQVVLAADGLLLPGGQRLSWPAVEEIAASQTACYLVEEGNAVKIQRFSETHNRIYVLMASQRAPTVLISGIQMHRVKDVDPWRDTEIKIRAIAPVTGRVLDTCTGLGYTAILAAQTAREVLTIELDPTMLEVARLNPWSRRLFDTPTIRQAVGDSFDVVPTLPPESFDRVIHDPPVFGLAGDLYSAAFYRELYRVLERRGRLYHYVGDPESRSGRSVTNGVIRRLQEAGFSRVVRKPDAFGLVAYK